MRQDIQDLSEKELRTKLRSLAEQDRFLVAEILLHLQVVEKNYYFALWGFSSIYEYAKVELGYSEAEAYLRITAARAMVVVPELKNKIETGALNLSNVAQAQRFFANEKKANHSYTPEEKKEILETLEGKSTREAELELASRSTNPKAFLKRDRTRVVDKEHSEIRFLADHGLVELLDQIKKLMAHENPNPTMAELVRKMAEITLEKMETQRFKKTKKAPETENLCKKGEKTENVQRSRSIPASVVRTVFRRDEYRCGYIDPETGRKCDSEFGTQLDHLEDFARGGENSVENLVVRCWTHNRLHAFQSYGQEKIVAFYGKR